MSGVTKLFAWTVLTLTLAMVWRAVQGHLSPWWGVANALCAAAALLVLWSEEDGS